MQTLAICVYNFHLRHIKYVPVNNTLEKLEALPQYSTLFFSSCTLRIESKESKDREETEWNESSAWGLVIEIEITVFGQ